MEIQIQEWYQSKQSETVIKLKSFCFLTEENLGKQPDGRKQQQMKTTDKSPKLIAFKKNKYQSFLK